MRVSLGVSVVKVVIDIGWRRACIQDPRAMRRYHNKKGKMGKTRGKLQVARTAAGLPQDARPGNRSVAVAAPDAKDATQKSQTSQNPQAQDLRVQTR